MSRISVSDARRHFGLSVGDSRRNDSVMAKLTAAVAEAPSQFELETSIKAALTLLVDSGAVTAEQASRFDAALGSTELGLSPDLDLYYHGRIDQDMVEDIRSLLGISHLDAVLDYMAHPIRDQIFHPAHH